MPQKKKLKTTHKKVQPFEWGAYIDSTGAEAVAVHSFKHVSLS